MVLWQILLISVAAVVIVSLGGTILGQRLSRKYDFPFPRKRKAATPDGATVSDDRLLTDPLQKAIKERKLLLEKNQIQESSRNNGTPSFEKLQAERLRLMQEKLRQQSLSQQAVKPSAANQAVKESREAAEKARLESERLAKIQAEQKAAAELERQNREKARLEAERLARIQAQQKAPIVTPSPVKQSLPIGAAALQEIQKNIQVAGTPWNGKVLHFESKVWDNSPTEFEKLTAEQKSELKEAYTDITMANNIVWLVNEVQSPNHDLVESYRKLCSMIKERLTRLLTQ